MNFYEEMEKRHPERQNRLGQNPTPPVPLLRCARCGSEPRPAFVYALYACPCYTVRCECCGQQTKPVAWAVGLMYTENPHTVTEPEALQRACEDWNAWQRRRSMLVTRRKRKNKPLTREALERLAAAAIRDMKKQRKAALALSRGCGE